MPGLSFITRKGFSELEKPFGGLYGDAYFPAVRFFSWFCSQKPTPKETAKSNAKKIYAAVSVALMS